jgi:hypothetical protein
MIFPSLAKIILDWLDILGWGEIAHQCFQAQIGKTPGFSKD